MGIGIVSFCKQGFEAIQQFAKSLPLLKTPEPSPHCNQIQTQLHLKTVEQGRAYIQDRLQQAREGKVSEGSAIEKISNWAKGYSYIDNGEKEGEIEEFQKIIDCVDTQTKDQLIPAMALECEIPGMRSGVGCWLNTKAVAETVITSGGTLYSKDIASKIKVEINLEDVWGNIKTLERHFIDHGTDFNTKNAQDYAKKAWDFFQNSGREGYLKKIDADGVMRIFDPSTGTFGSFNANGAAKTFFKPKSPTYWQRQPGILIK